MLPVLLYYCSSGWIPKPKDELQLTKEMLRLLWFCKTFRPFSSTKEMLQCCTCSKQIRCYSASNKMESCYLFGSALCCPHWNLEMKQCMFVCWCNRNVCMACVSATFHVPCALKMEDNNSYSGKHTRIKKNHLKLLAFHTLLTVHSEMRKDSERILWPWVQNWYKTTRLSVKHISEKHHSTHR